MHRTRHFVFALALPLAILAGEAGQAGAQTSPSIVPAGSNAASQAPAAAELSQAKDAAAQTPKFEVASVRLIQDRDKLPMAQQMYAMSPSGAGEFTVRNTRLDNLIGWAFEVGGFSHPITAEPAWANSTYYEVAARPEGDVGLTYDQLRPMVQELLKERFHLAYHMESGKAKGYALVIAKSGSKITPTKGAAQHAYMMMGKSGKLDAANAPMSLVALLLANAVGQAVVDETGLKGNFDMQLTYAPMEATDSESPSIFSVVEEQLGLKLVSQTVPVEKFVIDHVDREPTAN